MPRIFDNIDNHLIDALKNTINVSYRSDFCVGYFNLKGWNQISDEIESFKGGDGNCCRLLVGMQSSPHDEFKKKYSLLEKQDRMDGQKAILLKKRIADDFKEQLIIGYPSNQDEVTLKTLVRQIKEKKVRIKLYLRNNLHAKAYLLHREDQFNPIIGYLGSSNLTFSGLSKQGELNIDVLDLDAAKKLDNWFEDRWNDKFCLDISDEITDIIEKSWASEKVTPPFHIYSKMAYHLSQQARDGVKNYSIPEYIDEKLFEFQSAAIKLAANHLKKRKGVIIGDVVGLGKTLMATALMSMLEDEFYSALIIAPKNLVKMWESYCEEYQIRAEIIPLSMVHKLPETKRYRLVVIDESHNLRNSESKRYKFIQEYIFANDSSVILLTATPYNKTYLDLSSQLRLFIPGEQDLGIAPQKLISEIGETEFIRKYQCHQRSIIAFEHSEFPEDWRELMRLYLVRRTRSFIQDNYAKTEELTGRKYLEFNDGSLSYFPARVPKTVRFNEDLDIKDDQYSQLYADNVIDIINNLNLPRYRLGKYISTTKKYIPTDDEAKKLSDLAIGGFHLVGFTKSNLLKRLESSSEAFIKSISNHIMRNEVFVYALKNKLPLPIGTHNQKYDDFDEEKDIDLFEGIDNLDIKVPDFETNFKEKAKIVYDMLIARYEHKFNWVRHHFFKAGLIKHLSEDIENLNSILINCGPVDPEKDSKIKRLVKLVKEEHPDKKILVFTQYADTAMYIKKALIQFNVDHIESVTGASEDPTSSVWKFSPRSNNKKYKKEDQIRVMIATDILSEGQNLQDCSIIVNYDLPWAIIRLIQRAGRVDRIGQQSEQILCYSFMPAEGIEKIIGLRARVTERLKANAEVIGTDEEFFEEETISVDQIIDLYNEKSKVLDADDDNEVDLASYAYEVWKTISENYPDIKELIPKLPPVTHSTKNHSGGIDYPEGVLVYIQNTDGNDGLIWVDENDNIISQSPYEILKAAECKYDTKAIPKDRFHFQYVKRGVKHLVKNTNSRFGGQLGRPSGARFKAYERLTRIEADGLLLFTELQDLRVIIQEIYNYPLQQNARDNINKNLRTRVSDDLFIEFIRDLHLDDKLVIKDEEYTEESEPIILCSLGLFNRT